MTGREAWLSVGLIFVSALVVRSIFAAMLRFPTPEDTAYYVGVARNVVEGRGLVSDAIWSFQTPPLHFPRPAFEVWLPLPSLLALPAMAVLGPSFDAAKVPAVLVGSLVPVLAWRLAADVAEERGLAPGRARTLAIGTGLTAVVYLPLILFGALPDSTMPFATLALAATPADDPDPAPTTRRRRLARHPPARTRGRPRPRRADPERGGLAGPHLGRPRLVERSARPADRPGRRPGRHRPPDLRPVGDPRLGGLRQPAPRPGAGQRPVDHGLRHLRLERSADPRPLPGDRPGPARRAPSRGHLAQPGQRAPRAGLPGRPDRARGPPVDRASAIAPPARRRRDRDLPRDEPVLPGRHDLGNLPPRGRRDPRPAHRERPDGARRVHRPGGRLARLDPAGRLARTDPDDRGGAAVQRDPGRLRQPGGRGRPGATSSSPSGWRRSVGRSTPAPDRS